MYAKLRTNLIGLAAAFSFLVVGFSLGEAPSAGQSGPFTSPALAQADGTPRMAAEQAPPVVRRRGARMRHLAMPYVSFAALLPRQES